MVNSVQKKNEENRLSNNKEVGDISQIIKTAKLSLHIGLGMGSTIWLCVGGFRGQFEYLISGESVMDAGKALGEAEKNEVVISDNVRKIAPDMIGGLRKAIKSISKRIRK